MLAHQGAHGCQAFGGVASTVAMFRNKALKLLTQGLWLGDPCPSCRKATLIALKGLRLLK